MHINESAMVRHFISGALGSIFKHFYGYLVLTFC